MGWPNLAGLKKFCSEIFQDVDGAFSMKRAILFAFVILFIVITIYVVHYGVVVGAGAKAVYDIPEKTLSFLQATLDKIVDLIKWIGSMVLLERAPQAAAALRGNQTPSVTGPPNA